MHTPPDSQPPSPAHTDGCADAPSLVPVPAAGRYVDLHSHTTVSDGTYTPTQVVRAAAEVGLEALAITDHDTVGGLDEALAEGARVGLEIVRGVEISADMGDIDDVHVLGYFMDCSDPGFVDRLAYYRRSRADRNPRIIEKLRRMGVDISYDEVVAEAGDNGVVGRPHFARVMVRKRIVGTIQEAFNKFLANGAPAYVERERLEVGEAARMIHAAGGAAIVAHPLVYTYKDKRPFEPMLEQLADCGVDGFEAFHHEHNADVVALVRRFAARRGLIATGGSDFHGANKPTVSIGRARSGMRIPVELLDALRHVARGRAEAREAAKLAAGSHLAGPAGATVAAGDRVVAPTGASTAGA